METEQHESARCSLNKCVFLCSAMSIEANSEQCWVKFTTASPQLIRESMASNLICLFAGNNTTTKALIATIDTLCTIRWMRIRIRNLHGELLTAQSVHAHFCIFGYTRCCNGMSSSSNGESSNAHNRFDLIAFTSIITIITTIIIMNIVIIAVSSNDRQN